MVDKTPPLDERGTSTGGNVELAPSFDEPDALELLAGRRRRYVLYYLMNAPDDSVDLEELVDRVRDYEREAEGSVPDEHRHRVATSLHHCELPKLVDHGVVDYDPRSGTVRYHGDRTCEQLLTSLASE